jgi:tetratricopeptide (TPR) repeat protein
VRELRAALELDPLSGGVRDSLGLVLVSAGHYDEVLDLSHQALAVDPNDGLAQQLSGRALLQKGKLYEATAVFEGRRGDEGFLGYAYAQAGRRAEAEQIITQHPDWPWIHALVYAGLGDKDRVFEALEKMAAIKDPRVGMYLTYPELALLRGDPRLNEFRQKLSLPLMP